MDPQQVPSHHSSEDEKIDASSDKELHHPTMTDGEKGAPPVEAAAAADSNPPAPPAGPHGGSVPNGGTQAWLQVLGSWMLFFNTWGILNTFGVYQTYYESGDLFQTSSSDISWIGSIQSLMVLLIGALIGPFYDRGHFRVLLIAGSFGVVFGHMMLSLCHTFWQTLLAQGFVVGIGGGLLFVPAVAILPTYFSTKLGLAMGLAASGSSMGGIIYPIMFYKLLSEVGFAWAVRILGFTALATLMVPLAVMRMRAKPSRVRAMIDVTALTDGPYMLFVGGCLLGFIGLYDAIFYFSFFGQATGITDASMSFYLVPILNAGSVFGRTLPNALSDKVGPLNVIVPGAFMVGIVLFCNLAVHNTGGLVVNILAFGFFSGIFIALPPVVFVGLTKDKSRIGTRIGMGMAMFGLGVLAGGPGGGGILQRNGSENSELDWTGTWVFGGVCSLASGVVFLILRIWKGGFKLMVKC
ncbi:hypothetical protein LTR08_003877 [Meristemomyces frigidus]|nr:hypothetical protein LTR08_003877 [Meristemomyces frigidus]